MGKSSGRSASTGVQTAVTGQSTFKYATVEISSYITSVERHHNTVATSDTVALIKL